MAIFKKVSLLICLACLIVCVALCTVGCDDDKKDPTTMATDPLVITSQHTIFVRTAGGMLLDDVTVYVWKNAEKTDLVDLPKKLDGEGKYVFQATAGVTYTVELKGVPNGYDVKAVYTMSNDRMEIVLNSAPIAGEVPAGTTYKTGDIIHDYVLTAIDGVQYKVSDVLKQKKALVLNFWYVNGNSCVDELVRLQDAYALHGDHVEVLAINVGKSDTDLTIRGVWKENGLTFPVIKDQAIFGALQAGSCPTTVVIDRYGMISYTYSGVLSDPAAFRALLRHYGADAYEQHVLEGSAQAVNDLIDEIDIPYGCATYPYDVGAVEEFQGEVRANELVYYMLYRVANVILRIEDPDVYLVYEGNTYYPTDGVLEMTFPAPEDSFSGVKIALGTKGGEDKPIVLKQISNLGNSDNPEKITLGVVTLACNGIDRYYTFTAEQTGVFTIMLDALPEGLRCSVHMTNMRSFAVTDNNSEECTDPETGKVTFSIDVEAGDVVRIIFSAYSENAEITEIQAIASVAQGGEIGVSNEYCIKVFDEAGTPMPNVSLSILVSGQMLEYTTDDNGEVRAELEKGTYFVTLTLPDGYHATTQYLLTPASQELQILLVPTQTYVVSVHLTGVADLSAVQVKIYNNAKLEELIHTDTLDANLQMRFDYGYVDGFVVVLEGVPSTVFVQNSYPMTGNLTEIALVSTSIGDTNASNQHYQLGDKIADFSVVTPDGRVYTLYEILEQKQMVILNFWHSSDNASLAGFRVLQSMYETYGEQLEILAMNPLDKSDLTISNFQGTYDFGFPMVQCSEQWESAFHLTTYPTMVVIDRDGTVCLIQSGVVSDSELMHLLCQRFVAEDYTTTLLTDMQQLTQGAQPNGTQESPFVVAQGITELTVTLEAGQSVWYTFEELELMGISLMGQNVYIVYAGQTYEPVQGVVEVVINLDATQQQETVQIGNSGTETITLVISLFLVSAG